MILIIAAP